MVSTASRLEHDLSQHEVQRVYSVYLRRRLRPGFALNCVAGRTALVTYDGWHCPVYKESASSYASASVLCASNPLQNLADVYPGGTFALFLRFLPLRGGSDLVRLLSLFFFCFHLISVTRRLCVRLRHLVVANLAIVAPETSSASLAAIRSSLTLSTLASPAPSVNRRHTRLMTNLAFLRTLLSMTVMPLSMIGSSTAAR
jgi:hypothetical protein